MYTFLLGVTGASAVARGGSSAVGSSRVTLDALLNETQATAPNDGLQVKTPLAPDVRMSDADRFVPKKPFAWQDKMRDCTGFYFVECQKDISEGTKTWYHKSVATKDQKKITPKVCFEFCDTVPFSQFFGLENGDKCWCAPYIHKGADHGFCDMPCVGDKEHMCGGQSVASIYQMHDCDNLPAQRCAYPPPPMPNVKKTCTWGDTGANSGCKVDCMDGFDLVSNTIKCKEFGDRLVYTWGNWVGTAVCVPKDCGAPELVEHSRFPRAHVFFPDTAEYGCQLGFTVTGNATSKSDFAVQCQSNGSLSARENCLPVICGSSPQVERACRKGYFVEVRKVRQFIADLSCPGDSPGLDQTLVYTDEAKYECVEGYTLDAVAGGPKEFLVGCQASGQFAPPKECRAVVCGPSPDYKFSGKPLNTDDPGAPVRFPDVRKYECRQGYTLDATADRSPKNTHFEAQCQANGTFSAPPPCVPVSCGMPPVVEHGITQQKEFVFPEKTTFTCEEGYTLDGSAGGRTTFALTCDTDGLYKRKVDNLPFATKPYSCMPVLCGKPPEVELATTQIKVNVFFPSIVSYTAVAGHSLSSDDNPYKRTNAKFSLKCLPSGKFSVIPTVVEIDDCLVHSCGPNGKCEEVKAKTEAPDDFYRCQCDSGFEEIMKPSGQKFCININDCPAKFPCNDAGTCVDHVNAYTCECNQPGWHAVPMKKQSETGNQTCAPKICGVPEAVKHATVRIAKGEVFPSNAETQPTKEEGYVGAGAHYVCDEGYTLSGVPDTDFEFGINCTHAGRFTRTRTCKAVVCGAPPRKEHAKLVTQVTQVLYKGFQDPTEYGCVEGYTLDGSPEGVTTFKMHCEADGRITCATDAGCSCQPIKCKKMPTQEHASQVSCGQNCGKGLVFPEVAEFDCNEGYSTNGQANNAATAGFSFACQSSGEYSTAKQCEKVKCGKPPVVARQTVEEKKAVFQDTVEYTCDEGYSLNGNAEGKKTYSVTCQADGTYSPTQAAQPVKCGVPPAVANAERPKGPLVFKQKVGYTCHRGHSVDATAKGKASFEIECKADGTFTKAEECKPVECGQPEVPKHTLRQAEAPMFYPAQEALSCEPGYTLTGQADGATTFNITCQYDGEIDGFKQCMNLNDCGAPWGITCGGHGDCEDHEKPTGKHIDDYACVCKSGFEEVIGKDKQKTCKNINDCPVEEPCAPGACIDGINTYACSCPSGFHEVVKGNATCERNICGAAAEIAHSKRNNTEPLVFQDHVEYKCEEGHTITGHAEGPGHFVAVCHADRSIGELKMCQAVACGEAPTIKHAGGPEGEFFFDNEVHYTCDSGHSADGKADGKTEFAVKCLADGTFSESEVPECKPIECGEPKLEEFQHRTAEGKLVFGMSEVIECNPGYTLSGLARTEANAQYKLHCGATGSFSPAKKCINIDDCKAFGESCGGHGQCVDHEEPTGVHMEDFDCDCESGFEQVLDLGKKVCKNINDCGAEDPCAPGVCHDQVNSYNCQCPMGFHPEGKKNATCSRNICGPPKPRLHMTPSAEDELVYEDTVEFNCAEGYSLSGKVAGKKKFTATCQADSTIAPVEMPCLPVTCGTLSDTENAVEPKGEHHFKDKAVTNCDEGFSVDGDPNGDKSFEQECKADGTYTAPKQCVPVVCGVPELPPHSELKPGKEAAAFTESMTIMCKAGYSVSGLPDGDKTFDVHCLASGKFSPSKQCKNIDDCSPFGIDCGTHGECIDKPEPTGDHNADYECKCESGYEEMTDEVTGKRYCGDTPDCPPGACQPGTCRDLVNDYTCVCPEGYHEEKNGKKRDCVKNVCGKPQARPNSTPASTNKMVFEDRVVYKCKQGHSLDGSAAAKKEFSVACLADKSFAEPERDCQPIGCGAAPAVPELFAEPAHQEKVVFKGFATYNCLEGYTLTGRAGDSTTFESECLATGRFSKPQGCKPVNCGVPAVGGDEQRVEPATGEMYFSQQVTIKCKPGYSLDGLPAGEVSYQMTCGVDGSFGGRKECQNIDDCEPYEVGCGGNGVCVDHEKPTGKHLQDYSCKCDSGFEEITGQGGVKTCHNIDDCPKTGAGCTPGTCEDLINDYTCQCPEGYHLQPAGNARTCAKNKCGAPIEAEGATPHSMAAQFFGDTNKYTCNEGHTMDGTAGGRTHWTVTCGADGSQGPAESCTPVVCGPPPTAALAKTPAAERKLVFGEEATYKCNEGHTLSGAPGSVMTFKRKCQADGTFTAASQCQPVKCGLPALRPNSAFAEETAAPKTFSQAVAIRCHPGFALEPEMGAVAAFEATCEANGAFSGMRDCVNVNDCAGVKCGEGKCVDNAKPTGNHPEDYHCDCNSGFEELIDEVSRARACHNIDDCPAASTCLPGACADLINDYECVCPEVGYHRGDHKCDRNQCLATPQVAHSDASTTERLLFQDTVTFTCAEGYSVDGSAAGVKTFVGTCNGEGEVEGVLECKPVECGDLPDVENAKFVPRSLVFPQTQAFQCEVGYTTTGAAGGPAAFTASCGADGGIHGVEACLPVICESPPTLENTKAALAPVPFNTEITYTAILGWSVDGTPEHRDTITTCQADGSFTDVEPVVKVYCGIPEMAEKVEEGNYFPGVHFAADFVSAVGAELTDLVGRKVFTNPNVAIAACTKVDACHMVKIHEETERVTYSLHATPGPEAAPLHTQVRAFVKAFDPEGPEFGDYYHFVCKEGFTLDGTAVGVGSFAIRCRADGTFSEAPGACKPVVCGPPPALDHAAVEAPEAPKFGENATYTCAKGYTVGGLPKTAEEDWTPVDGERVPYHGRVAMTKSGRPCQKWTRQAPHKHSLMGDGHRGSIRQGERCWGVMEGMVMLVPCKDGEPTQTFTVPSGTEAGLITVSGKTLAWDAERQMARLVGEPTPTSMFTVHSEDGKLESMMQRGKCLVMGMEGGASLTACDNPNIAKLALPAGMKEGEEGPDGLGDHNFCRNPSADEEDTPWCYTMDPEFPRETCNIAGPIAAAGEFTATCSASGTFVKVVGCRAVSCGAPPDMRAGHAAPQTYKTRRFGEEAQYQCHLGHSLDGTEAGGAEFVRACEETGAYAEHEGCKKIDFCAEHDHCTEHGTCVNLLQGYQCNCHEGYRRTKTADGFDTCVEIDECVAWQGNDECGVSQGMGKCIDKVNAYECECNTGFEVKTSAQRQLPICARKFCGNVPEVAHSTSIPAAGAKAFYPAVAAYSCKPGFTLDETPTGDVGFEVECLESGKFSELFECKRVTCGKPVEVENAKAPAVDMFVGDTAVYTCKPGHSVDGSPNGQSYFVTKCEANGAQSEPRGCKPLTCGVVPAVAFATFDQKPLGFSEKVEYQCAAGYTVSGQADGEKQFEVQCDKDGALAVVGKEYIRTAPKTVVMKRVGFGFPTGGSIGEIFPAGIEGIEKGDCVGACGRNPTCKWAALEEDKCHFYIGAVAADSLEFTGDRTSKKVIAYQKVMGIKGAMVAHDGAPTGSESLSLGAIKPSLCLSMCSIDAACTGARAGRGETPACYHYYKGGEASLMQFRTRSRGFANSTKESPEEDSLPAYNKETQEIEKHTVDQCQVEEMKCQFPFQYKGEAYSSCTTAGTIETRAPKPPKGDKVKHMEVGAVTFNRGTNGEPRVAEFVERFEAAPIVLTGVPGLRGGHPIVASVPGIFNEGVMLKWREPTECGYDGQHTTEMMSWMALPAGTHETDDGVIFEVGEANLGATPATVNFAQELSGDVVVLTAAMDYVQEYYTISVDEVTAGSFTMRADTCKYNVKSKQNSLTHMTNRVAWMAIPAGTGAIGGARYVAEVIDGVNHKQKSIDLGELTAPAIFASLENTGGDPSNLRSKDLSGSSVTVQVHEGNPTMVGTGGAGHKKEKVYFMAIEQGSFGAKGSEVAPWCFTEGEKGQAHGPWQGCTRECIEATTFPTCNPVSCGLPPKVENGFAPLIPRVYKEQVTVTCAAGHTTTGTAVGDSAFALLCRADGHFDEAKQCKPIACGVPPRTPHGAPVDEKEFVYNEEAHYHCDKGFSLNGLPGGAMTCQADLSKGECIATVAEPTNIAFKRRCTGTGEFSAAAALCAPVDFCQPRNPCGRNGECSNVLDENEIPIGYQCKCFEGFEVETLEDGLVTCGADDCAGKSCGEGGACKDLGKGPSEYTCECLSGYELRFEDDGSKTCRRKACVMSGKLSATIPFVPHATFDLVHAEGKAEMAASMDEGCEEELAGEKQEGYKGCVKRTISGRMCQKWNVLTPHVPDAPGVSEWDHNYCRNPTPASRDRIWCYTQDPVIPWEYCAPELEPVFTGDAVDYQCTRGHSIDGTTSPESKGFAVFCRDSGMFSGVQECQRVKCDKSKVPVVDNAASQSSISDLYAFGDTIQYDCDPGFSIGGKMGAGTSFVVNCRDDGTFSNPPTCSPISCGVPTKIAAPLQMHGAWSVGTELAFGKSAAFTCDMGHVLPDGTSSYTVVCGVGGQFITPEYEVGCTPVICGLPPAVANAPTPSEQLTFGTSVTYQCEEGHSTNGAQGGAIDFDVTCAVTETLPPMGMFVGVQECKPVGVNVQGVISDASNPAGIKIPGAKVCHLNNCQFTDEAGIYSLTGIPMGKVVLTASAEGYISSAANLTVSGNIDVGQEADMNLPKMMKPDEFRVVIQWGNKPLDLDSHLYYGANARECHTMWYNTMGGYCPNNGAAEGILEYDYTRGYGPETTWIKSTGHCTAADKNKYCRMVFKVKNYNQYAGNNNPDGTSYDDPSNSIGQSGLVVHLFRGAQHVGDYQPPADWREIEWPVFTIDLSNKDVHPGEANLDDPAAEFIAPPASFENAASMFSNYRNDQYMFEGSEGFLAGLPNQKMWLKLRQGGYLDGYAQLQLDEFSFQCLEAQNIEGRWMLVSAACGVADTDAYNAQQFQFFNLGTSKPAVNIQLRSYAAKKCVSGTMQFDFCAFEGEEPATVWEVSKVPLSQKFSVITVEDSSAFELDSFSFESFSFESSTFEFDFGSEFGFWAEVPTSGAIELISSNKAAADKVWNRLDLQSAAPARTSAHGHKQPAKAQGHTGKKTILHK